MLLNIVFTDLIRHTVYVAKNAKLKLISSMIAKKRRSRLGTAEPERRESMSDLIYRLEMEAKEE